MPRLRLSRAGYPYECAICAGLIRRKQLYFRDEPHPFARMRGTATTRKFCLQCVLGPDTAQDVLSNLCDSRDLPPGFELLANGFLRFPPRVSIVDLTPQVLDLLGREPERLYGLSAEEFENLVCNLLEKRGFDLERVGSGTYQKDGGIDIIAWQRDCAFRFLIAVQAKHTASRDRKIGPGPVHDLLGTVQMHGLNAGLVVTNTTFTPDARWVAEQRAILMKLRDIDDLRRWLRNECVAEHDWREIPSQIEVCPGIVVPLGR